MVLLLMRTILLFMAVFMAAFPVNAQYTLNGNATQDACNLYTLTKEANTQSGSVWNNNKINLTQSFDFKFDVYLGTKDAGADGIAFVLQPISTSVGTSGGGLGYQGVTPAVGITIDTWQNTENNDPVFDHIAIQLNGDINHAAAGNIAGPVQAVAGNDNIEDGLWHAFRIQWDAATKTLTAYIDGVQRVSVVKDFVADIFSGDPMVFWGFTGSTGGANNLQRFKIALNPAYKSLAGQKRCINEPISFTDSTVSFTAIAKFYWDFGDGSPVDSVTLNPVHSYTLPGDYLVQQRVIGADGCQAVNQQILRIGVKPNAAFMRVSEGCLGKPLRFYDSSYTSFGTIDKWFWDFGDAGLTSTLQNPVISYPAYGYKNVKLTVTSPEGCESAVFSKTVKVKTAIASFTYTDSVCLGTPASFHSAITILPDGAPEWYDWNFAGNLGNSNNPDPSYIFPNPGVNTALLVVLFGSYNDTPTSFAQCLAVSGNNVFVINKPLPNFTYNTICQSAPVTLTDSSYTTDNIPVTQWWWNLNGGITGTQNTISTTYANAGVDTVKLVVHNSKGCVSDTLKKAVIVNPKPVAKFGISSLLCDGQAVQFSDSSAVTGSTVTKWSWLYNNAEWSNQQNTSKIFTAGSQTAGLAATSALGCKSDTFYKTFYINPVPSVDLNFKDACKFSPVNFTGIDNSGTVTQWKWEFGDGSIAGTQNAQHTYNANGSYTVKLNATAATGCYTGTLQKDITIYGTNAFAGNDTIAAAGQPVQLHATGGLSYTWSPANLLNNASIADPVTVLSSTQIFTLKAFTPEGCESYDDVLVKIYNGPEIYLPNAFTPNGDGRNDIFRGIPVGLQEFNYLKIYNRWGQMVFYTADHRNGWDGSWQGKLQPGGVYVVIARGKDYKGNSIEKKGTILLIR